MFLFVLTRTIKLMIILGVTKLLVITLKQKLPFLQKLSDSV